LDETFGESKWHQFNLGVSWFIIILDLVEFLPGKLLFFIKTYYLGSILLFPVMLNVFLINYELDLWDGTQFISSYLLVINLILLLTGWKSILIPSIQKI